MRDYKKAREVMEKMIKSYEKRGGGYSQIQALQTALKAMEIVPELVEALNKITATIGGLNANPIEFIRLVESLNLAQQALSKIEGSE